MKTAFPLFSSHLDLAHDYWKRLLKEGDAVIDATCGNGHDALALAKMVLGNPTGSLTCIDNQQVAIENTRQLLTQHLSPQQMQQVHWIDGCHAQLPNDAVNLIVYNLGYLPGGNKQHTTQLETTLTSIENALKILCGGGCVSITAYPGHAEGAREERDLLEWVRGLDPKVWSCCHHRWLNRNNAPSLLLIQKTVRQ